MCNYDQSIGARDGAYKHIVRTNGRTAYFQMSANAALLLRSIIIKGQAINFPQKLLLFCSCSRRRLTFLGTEIHFSFGYGAYYYVRKGFAIKYCAKVWSSSIDVTNASIRIEQVFHSRASSFSMDLGGSHSIGSSARLP